jgi:hypothetical protein
MGTDIWGIDDGYEDALGAWRETPAVTRSALLAARKATIASPIGGGGYGPTAVILNDGWFPTSAQYFVYTPTTAPRPPNL